MFSTGRHPIPKALKQRVKAVADDSFVRTVVLELEDLPDLPDGWSYALDTAIALKLKGRCDPHCDDFMGAGSPEMHASLFWLFSDTSKRMSVLTVGEECHGLRPGEWALFEDRKLHAFLADGTWVGVAVQAYR